MLNMLQKMAEMNTAKNRARPEGVVLKVGEWQMKRLAILLCPLLLAAVAARGQTSRDDRWRQDITFLSTELPRLHVNAFFRTPKGEFEATAASLSGAVPTLSDAQVIAGLARLSALIGDAHTAVALDQPAARFRTLPFELMWFDDGLYTLGSGARVVAMGSLTPEQALLAVAPYISHENVFWLRQRSASYLARREVLELIGAWPRWTLEIAGQRVVVDLSAPSGPAFLGIDDGAPLFTPLTRRNPERNYWYTYLDSARTLYFRYNRCQEDPLQPFAGFAAELLRVFDSQPVERLVIDFRGNGGGSSAVIQPFYDGLQARFSRLGAVHLFSLIDRGVFSSALLNALPLKGVPFVHVIGEPTGGKPAHYGEVRTFQLPNSGLTASYSVRYFDSPIQTDALEPDFPAPLLWGEYAAGHDAALAAALAWPLDGAGPTTVTTGSAIAVLNGASLRVNEPVAPGSLASAFGDFSGVASADAQGDLFPKVLGDVEVLINGAAAPLLAVRSGQINFQVPRSTALGRANITVRRGGSILAVGELEVDAAAPGLFSNGVFGGPVLQMFGTGQGPTDRVPEDGAPPGSSPLAQARLTARVFVGTEPAEVLYSGLSAQYAGLWQINVRTPGNLMGWYPVFVIINGRASNPGRVLMGR